MKRKKRVKHLSNFLFRWIFTECNLQLHRIRNGNLYNFYLCFECQSKWNFRRKMISRNDNNSKSVDVDTKLISNVLPSIFFLNFSLCLNVKSENCFLCEQFTFQSSLYIKSIKPKKEKNEKPIIVIIYLHYHQPTSWKEKVKIVFQRIAQTHQSKYYLIF